MHEKIDIHNSDRLLKGAQRRFEQDQVHPHNRKAIEEFLSTAKTGRFSSGGAGVRNFRPDLAEVPTDESYEGVITQIWLAIKHPKDTNNFKLWLDLPENQGQRKYSARQTEIVDEAVAAVGLDPRDYRGDDWVRDEAKLSLLFDAYQHCGQSEMPQIKFFQ